MGGVLRGSAFRTGGAIAAIGLTAALSACSSTGMMPALKMSSIGETRQHGFVLQPDALQQIPVGSSREQVLIALGSPSTTAQFGGEVLYYISQTRHRPARFMQDKVVDQQVVAVYLDKKGKVERVAHYGLQDGKVFDFVSRTTPTGGDDLSFLQQVLSGGPSLSSILGGGG